MLPLPIDQALGLIAVVFTTWFIFLRYFVKPDDPCEWHDFTPLHPFHFTKEGWFGQLQRRWNWRDEKWEYRRREATADEWSDRF